MPTDNLYKFMAVFGLIVFLLSAYFPRKQTQELELKRIDVESRQKALMHEQEIIKEEQESISEGIKRDFRESYGDSIYHEFIKVFDTKNMARIEEFIFHLNDMEHAGLIHAAKPDTARIKSLIVRSLKLNPKISKLVLTADELTMAAEELQIFASYTRHWRTAARVGVFVGGILIVFGFSLWYVLLQRPQDILLKRKVQSALSATSQDSPKSMKDAKQNQTKAC
jgi:hypothetical protein